MNLLCLPAELRDVVYDYLLDGVTISMDVSSNTCAYVKPAVPKNVMLVNRRMYDEIGARWSELSEITIVGHGQHCIGMLASVVRPHLPYSLTRAVTVNMTSSYDVPFLQQIMSIGVLPSQDIRAQLPQLVGLCRTMPHLEKISLEIKTVSTRRNFQNLELFIENHLHPHIEHQSSCRTFDRWYQAVRTDTEFSWKNGNMMTCHGTLKHLAIERKMLSDVDAT
jgi:hypothetical protein